MDAEGYMIFARSSAVGTWLTKGHQRSVQRLSIKLSLIGSLSIPSPEAVGKGSSTTVLVKYGRIVYTPKDITIVDIMINAINIFLFMVDAHCSCVAGSFIRNSNLACQFCATKQNGK